MTGLGVEIVRRDEIRLLEDTDLDGYADTSTVFAKGFNSIQGLAYSDGSVFVMHAPFLTRLRDVNSDGVADERRDLVKGLGLPPEENSNRLHCANGVVAGHDGWLYLALGDRGCDVMRPEGDRLLFQQGGILRCRPDGSDLHVFSSGLRNIYDIALDEELNVFVRDNENDGGDYLIRVCYCFHGSDHGYPYHYYERPNEAMPPLAELGRGSSAGGVCYMGSSFPEEYRGNLFFCEWGRSVVRYPLRRSESGFAPTHEIEFAAAAENDPYGLKPTDLVVDQDGSLLVSDWGDGQRPKRGRGRIYRVQFGSNDPSLVPKTTKNRGSSVDNLISQLNSPRYSIRVAAQQALEDQGAEAIAALKKYLNAGSLSPTAKLHAVWLLSRQKHTAVEDLFNLARHDSDPRVRVQAIRAIADLTDPILVHDRLTAGRGDPQVASRMAQLAAGEPDARVRFEVLIALRRLQWKDAPRWLAATTSSDDPAWTHAAMQLLRDCDNWRGVLGLLDHTPADDSKPNDRRAIALLALAQQAEPLVVDGLIERIRNEAEPDRKIQLADALARVHCKPGPWTYWGFRPGPRPANRQPWSRTEMIEQTLNGTLRDSDHDVRAFVLERMLREEIPIQLETLASWLREETDQRHVAVIIKALEKRPTEGTRPLLQAIVTDVRFEDENRLAAVALLVAELDESTESTLPALAKQLEDGPVLAALLAEFGRRPKNDVDGLLLGKLKSREAVIRAAAIQALGNRNAKRANEHLSRLLDDSDINVRRQAVIAAGLLQNEGVQDQILKLTEESDQELKRACLATSKQLGDPRAVDLAVAALQQQATQLAALDYLHRFGNEKQVEHVLAAASRSLDASVQQAAVSVLSAWEARAGSDAAARLREAIAKLHATTGVLIRWSSESKTERVVAHASGIDSHVQWPTGEFAPNDSDLEATSEVFVPEETEVELLASSNGTLSVLLNDVPIFARPKKSLYRPDSDRFTAKFAAEMNQLTVRIADAKGTPRFHLRFRERRLKEEQERLAQFILSNRGNAQDGQKVYRNVEKSLCMKCHRLGTEGGRIGPDLTGIGSRLSRVHLIEAILEPNRTVAPSYETIVVVLSDGRILSGVRTDEDESNLTLGDAQGNVHRVSKNDIEERQVQSHSTMPEGLEKRLNDREWIDLITYLTSQTE